MSEIETPRGFETRYLGNHFFPIIDTAIRVDDYGEKAFISHV